MDFDDGGVDHCVLHVRIIRHGIKKAFENITLDPIPVSLEDRVPGAEQRRQVAPRAPGSRDPQHRFNKTPVFPAAATGIGSLPPAMQFHLRPLGIAQYTAVHPKLESQYRAWGNPNSQQTLEGVLAVLFLCLSRESGN